MTGRRLLPRYGPVAGEHCWRSRISDQGSYRGNVMMPVNDIRRGEVGIEAIDDGDALRTNGLGERSTFRAEHDDIVPPHPKRAGEVERVEFRAGPMYQRVIRDQHSHTVGPSARSTGAMWSAYVIIVR